MFSISKKMKNAYDYMVNVFGKNFKNVVSVSKYSSCDTCIHYGESNIMVFYCDRAETNYIVEDMSSCKYYRPTLNFNQHQYLNILIMEFEIYRKRFGLVHFKTKKKGLKLLW